MISFNRRTRVYLCKDPTDMRSSYDTLFSRVQNVLNKNPKSGHIFVFINKSRTSCKCLFYDGTGLVILSKRLEEKRFMSLNPFHKKRIVFSEAEFSLFFQGSDLKKRFIESPKIIK